MTSPRESAAIEAEQQLLGAILLHNDSFASVSDVMRPEYFFDPVHRRIWEICVARIPKGHIASPVSVAVVMDGDPGLAQLGGKGYLARMAGTSISPQFVRDYAKIIVEAAARRALAGAADDALAQLVQGDDCGEVKAKLIQCLSGLPETSGEESTYSILSAFTRAAEDAVSAYQGRSSYLKTGVAALDGIIKGLGPGDYMLLGGATSMGKTSLALEIAARVAMDQGKGVAFASLEMSKEQLATRMAAAVARVPYAALREPSDMSEDDFQSWIRAGQKISEAPLRIVPKHVRDIAGIHAAVTRAKRELGSAGLGLIIVDYAQLVRGGGKGRYEQMTDVSIGFKALAGMMGCPIIALVQLSRDIGFRDDKRPHLSDIKESGQFENDADQAVFCYREAYYLERQGPKANRDGQITDEARADWTADLQRCRNVMELLVRKNRHGSLGSVAVGFHDATNRFWNLSHQPDMEF